METLFINMIASKNALIIFTRNPELGKVKTRLAATIGNQSALEIYKLLIHHTVRITSTIFKKMMLGIHQFLKKNYKTERI